MVGYNVLELEFLVLAHALLYFGGATMALAPLVGLSGISDQVHSRRITWVSLRWVSISIYSRGGGRSVCELGGSSTSAEEKIATANNPLLANYMCGTAAVDASPDREKEG